MESMKDETYQKRLGRMQKWVDGQVALRGKVERVLGNINDYSCNVAGFCGKLDKAGVKHVNWCWHWAIEAEDCQPGRDWDEVKYTLIANTAGDLKVLWEVSREGERRYGEVFSVFRESLEDSRTAARLLDDVRDSHRQFHEAMKALERLTPALEDALDKTWAIMGLDAPAVVASAQ